MSAISPISESDIDQKIYFTYSYRRQTLLDTMLEVTKKIESDFFCDESILEQGIEFIGLINKQGKLESALFHDDIGLTAEKKEMYMMGLRLQSSMQSDYDSDFGPVSYTLTERGKSKFVSIVNFPYIVLAIMKKSKNHIAVIGKIKTALRNFQNFNRELTPQESDRV
jgi:hypothetical protein